MKRYLFFVEQPYCYSILRPLQTEILSRGDEVAWFLTGSAVNSAQLLDDEIQLNTVAEVKAYNPIAVFVPGNVVPDFFPGVKVQVFHGLEWKKKSHFVIRDFFDLYCTHGKITTQKFKKLSQERNSYFYVKETGWPKLDPYLKLASVEKSEKIRVVYAPTFSPKLTSVYALFDQILALSKTNRFEFLVKFHPIMNVEWVNKFRAVQNENLIVSDENDLLAVFTAADIVLSDTSSAVTEALLLGKKVVTFKNSQPQSCLIDFSDENLLEEKLLDAAKSNIELEEEIDAYLQNVHPWRDGKCSVRILDAVDEVLTLGVKQKPLNVFRKLKIRKALGYFRWK